MKSSPEPLRWCCGGPLFGWTFGDLMGSLRWSSIFWITTESVSAEMTAILPPQTLQVSMSILKRYLAAESRKALGLLVSTSKIVSFLALAGTYKMRVGEFSS